MKRFSFALVAVIIGTSGWHYVRPIRSACPEDVYVTECIDMYGDVPQDMVDLLAVIMKQEKRDNDLVRPIPIHPTEFDYTTLQLRFQGLWGRDLKVHSEEDIARFYLARSEYASGIWGLHAAADYYFHKRIEELTRYESIFLLTAYLNPHFHHPFLHPDMFSECFGMLARLADRYGIFSDDGSFSGIASEDWLKDYYDGGRFPLRTIAGKQKMPHEFDPNEELDRFVRRVMERNNIEGHVLIGNIQTRKMEAVVSNDITALFAKHEPREMLLPIVYVQALAQGMYPGTTIKLDEHLMKGKEELMYWSKADLLGAGFPYETDLRTAFSDKNLAVLSQLIDFIEPKNMPDLLGPYGLRKAFNPIYAREGLYQDGRANFFELFKAYSLLASEGQYFEYSWDEVGDIRDWYEVGGESLLSIETVNRVSPRWANQMVHTLFDVSADGVFKTYSGVFAADDYRVFIAYNDQYVMAILTDEINAQPAENLQQYVFDFLSTKGNFYTDDSYVLQHTPDKEQDGHRIEICRSPKSCVAEWLPPAGVPLVVGIEEDRVVYAYDPDMILEDRVRMEYIMQYMDASVVSNKSPETRY